MPVKNTNDQNDKHKKAIARNYKKYYLKHKGTYICQYCSKGYSSKQALKRHEANSCPEKPIER